MSKPYERRTESRVNNASDFEDTPKSIKNSLITDISPAGAGISILKDLGSISGNVFLNILQPELSSLSGFKIHAEVVWSDYERSKDFIEIGVEFSNTDDEENKYISQAINWFKNKDNHFLRCEVTQN